MKLTSSDWITLIAAIIAGVISLIAIIISRSQYLLSKRSNAFPITIEMFKEFRSHEFKVHINFIISKLPLLKHPKKDMKELPEDVQKHILTVSHYFDNLGVMVATNAVDKKLVISFLGGTATKVWEILYPYIKTERVKRENGIYQEFFENLVWEIKKNPPEKVKRKLHLKRLDS